MQNFLSLISTLRFNSYFTFRVPETTPISDPNFPLILNQKHKEPFDIDGFTTGNKEIFAAVGIPHKSIEDVYLYYTENQPINHFFSASNLSLFVGPNKTYTFLKVLYNEFKCQDYAISYKKDGKQLSIPLWKFDEQYIYRINKTPILVSKFKNEDLFIEIITYAPVGEDDRSFPLLVRSVIVNNISSSKLENILFLSIFANKGQTWNITSKQKFEVVISEKSNKPNEANESSMPNMTYVCDTLFDGYSTIEDLDDFSSLELPFEDQNKIENFTINDSYGIILSTKFENLDPGTPGLAHFTLWANDNSENSGQLSGNLIHEIDFYRLLLETIKQEEMWKRSGYHFNG